MREVLRSLPKALGRVRGKEVEGLKREPIDVKVSDLTPRHKHVNLRVKVVEIESPRTIVSRRDGSTHRVADAVVGDETGIIKMTLWDDMIDMVAVGDIIMLRNAYVTVFRGGMRLNVGKYGSLEVVGGEDIEVLEENDMSKPYLLTERMARRSPARRGPSRRRRRPQR